MIADGSVQIASCTSDELSAVRDRSAGLGAGEVEALSIAHNRSDRALDRCVVLTDDAAARKLATRMGINSLDAVSFIFLANQNGVITKNAVRDALEALGDGRYRIRSDMLADFVRRLK